MAHLVLIPGLWLDASSWDAVVPHLEAAGHRATPLTLPGMDAPDADRSEVSLADAVATVVAALDAIAPDDVVVVGHSVGAGIAWAAVDARPERVRHAVLVGGFPTGHGDVLGDAFPASDGEVALPDWSAFSEDDLADLDAAALDGFRDRAVPSPERLLTDPQRLHDERRYGVPVTVICPEFRAEDLRAWIEAGAGPVRELARVSTVHLVDLPTGHWPQLTRPADLAAAILDVVAAR